MKLDGKHVMSSEEASMSSANETYIRWETPVSDLAYLALLELRQVGLSLTLDLEGKRGDVAEQWRVVFRRQAGYANLREEYRARQWSVMPKTAKGWTIIHEESPWLAELRAEERFDLYGNAAARHYMVCTEDDVIDVLSVEPPVISRLVASEVAAPGST